MPKLNSFVHAVERHEDGSHGRTATFGPDDTVPDWAVVAISNPDVWDEQPDKPVTDPQSNADPVKEPPRGGPRSSADAWREFATSQNLNVPDGASAKEIQAIWDARS